MAPEGSSLPAIVDPFMKRINNYGIRQGTRQGIRQGIGTVPRNKLGLV
jgi:hypothetical protein